MFNKRRKTAPTSSVNGLLELETLEDRISDLPDSILAHILTKLSTKSAVGTTLLSARWKHLFSQIPNPELSINDSHLLHPRHVSDTDMVNQRRYSNFVAFMNNLFSVHLRDVPRIRSFYLFLHRGYADCEMNAWISSVLARNVSDLWIFCHAEHFGVLHDFVFRSASLVKLILCYIKFVKSISSSVGLPNLKSLCLVDVTFENVDSLERVIAACPVLESLSMCDCKFESPVWILHISSPSVRDAKLGMVSDCWSDGIYGLELDMPALESLHYEDHVPERYCVKSLSSVRRAFIQVGPSKKQMEDEVEKIWHRFKNIGDFVGSCSNVCSLYLSNLTVAVLNCLCHPMPAFHNLTELELSKIGSAGWELLPRFLESAPNLEVLVFKGGFSEYIDCYSKFQSTMLEHVPKCLTLHLRTIKFEAFKGEEDELDLVEYFLNHAQVLRNIDISFSYSVATEKLRDTKSKLWSLRNQSRKQQVDFGFEVQVDYMKFLSLAMKDTKEADG